MAFLPVAARKLRSAKGRQMSYIVTKQIHWRHTSGCDWQLRRSFVSLSNSTVLFIWNARMQKTRRVIQRLYYVILKVVPRMHQQLDELENWVKVADPSGNVEIKRRYWRVVNQNYQHRNYRKSLKIKKCSNALKFVNFSTNWVITCKINFIVMNKVKKKIWQPKIL